MYKRLHPYSIILGLLFGIGFFVALRVPLFALLGGFCTVLIADMFLNKTIDEDDKS